MLRTLLTSLMALTVLVGHAQDTQHHSKGTHISILHDFLEMDIPEGFHKLRKTELRKQYEDKVVKPEMVYHYDNDRLTNFAVWKHDIVFNEEDFEQILNGIKDLTKREKWEFVYYKYKDLSGKKALIVCYASPDDPNVEGDGLFNIALNVKYEDDLLTVYFACPIDQRQNWAEIAEEAINSVKINVTE